MLNGLMQPRPLMISDILRHAARAHPAREIVSRLVDEPDWRYDYAGMARRCARAANLLLSLGIALDGHPRVHALAGDTDGVDGQEEIAGAVLGPDSLARAWQRGIRPQDSLADNDGHGFFGALGDAVITGPTLTNVNDFRAIYIDAPGPQ